MAILKNIKDMILEQIQDKANRSELPTRVSDLNDDLNLATEEDLNLKVDKETGKGLSTNDFTNDLFSKLKNFFYESNLYLIETMIDELNRDETFNAIYTNEKTDIYTENPTLETINSLFDSPEQIINDYYTYIKFDEGPVQFAIIPLEVEETLFKVYIYMNNGINSMVLDLTKADIDPSMMPDLSDYIQISNTSGLIKNDGTIDTKQYLDTSQQSHSNKNVVVNSNGEIDFEDKPTIPEASSSTPTMDTTKGATGDGTTWARSNHSHPKSDLYAESTHTHSITDIDDIESVPVIITYTDNSTESRNLLFYTPEE